MDVSRNGSYIAVGEVPRYSVILSNPPGIPLWIKPGDGPSIDISDDEEPVVANVRVVNCLDLTDLEIPDIDP